MARVDCPFTSDCPWLPCNVTPPAKMISTLQKIEKMPFANKRGHFHQRSSFYFNDSLELNNEGDVNDQTATLIAPKVARWVDGCQLQWPSWPVAVQLWKLWWKSVLGHQTFETQGVSSDNLDIQINGVWINRLLESFGLLHNQPAPDYSFGFPNPCIQVLETWIPTSPVPKCKPWTWFSKTTRFKGKCLFTWLLNRHLAHLLNHDDGGITASSCIRLGYGHWL